MNKTGGPAFPNSVGVNGMTLRDWFAGQVISQLLGQVERIELTDRPIVACSYYATAAEAYRVADAMLAARGGKEDS